MVNVEFDINGCKINFWYDFEEYQYMLCWKEECEYVLWYFCYNCDSNGVIYLWDENNCLILIGVGVLDQILNFIIYICLIVIKFCNVVCDVFYGVIDSQEMNLVWFIGFGGLEEFDNVMKEEIVIGQYIKNIDLVSFIMGFGCNLKFGGFFISYQYIDGYIIIVCYFLLFDYGVWVKNFLCYLVMGLLLESYCMVGLDMSMYDGQFNVIYVICKKCEMVCWVVVGVFIFLGFNGNVI